MTKSLNTINKFSILFSIFFIALFGKNFALIDIPYVPGFTLDFILMLLLFFAIFLIEKPYSNTVSSKELFILSYFSIFLFYHFVTAQTRDINELGQDSLTILYPVIIYCIYKFSNFRLKISKNFIKFSLVVYSIYIILDFTFERSVIIKSFLGIDLTNLNIPSLNLIALKPTEAIFYLSILLFFFTKYSRLKSSFILIFPGICFGLYMSDSRTVLYGSIIYVFLLFVENKENLGFKDLFFLFIGICLSFSFVITDNESDINTLVSAENSDVGISSDVGIRRVRENSATCFVENLLVKRDKENCEKSQSGFKSFNYGYFPQTEKQGFVTDATRSVIIRFNEIVNLYGSADIFNEIIFNCFQESTSRTNPCDYEALSIYNEFIQIRNTAYEDLCGDNITWRVNLWKKTLYNENSDALNIFFGNGIGYSIPSKLISENQLPLECYTGTQDSIRPLRNAHNTYLTFFYRYGIINLILISYLLFLALIKLYKNKNFSIVVFSLITTSLDPILDSPIVLFTFCFLIFYLLDQNKT
tara:strand:+ start:14150 stop:15736 length:1587 start_codon:yes stop_codon:yes gene_type:complete